MSHAAGKGKKSKSEVIRTALGKYMKQRNYTTHDRFRKSELLLTQSVEELAFNKMVDGEVSKSNSFLYSNVFCLNNNPFQVDQQFARFVAFVQSQRKDVKEELEVFIAPLLCHLCVEMLKGRDWKPAIHFLKKNASTVAPVTPILNGTSVLADTLEPCAHITFLNESDAEAETETEDDGGASSQTVRSNFKQIIVELSSITKIDEITDRPLLSHFRSYKYEVTLSPAALNALKRYLSKHGHVLIMQILQLWFHIDVQVESVEIDDNDDEPDFAGFDDSEYALNNGIGALNHPSSGIEAARQFVASKRPVDINQEVSDECKLVSEKPKISRLMQLEKACQNLNRFQLPIRVLNILNTDNRLCAAAIDSLECHIVAGFEGSNLSLWPLNRSTSYGRKPWASITDRKCPWNVANCDRSLEDEDCSSDEESKTHVPKFVRSETRKQRWESYMNRRCEENSFAESGGLTLRGHSRAVTNVLMSSYNPLLYSVSRDHTMRVWKAHDYNCAAVYKGHNHPVWSVAESSNGMYLATGSRDTTARLWTTDRPFSVQLYVGHTQDVDCVAFHPNGNYLATGSTDHTVRLWCVTSGKLSRVFTDCRLPVQRIAFSPDGKLLAAGGEESKVRVFDLAAGTQLVELHNHTTALQSVAWNLSGSRLATACTDGSIRVWDRHKFGISESNPVTSNLPNASTATSSSLTNPTTHPIISYMSGCKRIVNMVYNENDTITCIGNT